MNNKKPRLSAKQSQELTKLITITKTATLKAVMDPGELAKVIAVVASDLDQTAEMASAFPLFWDDCAPPAEYYSLDLEWFTASNDKVTPHDVVDMLEYGKTLDKCCIPDDCIDPKRYPLFMARAVLQELIESLQSPLGVKPC